MRKNEIAERKLKFMKIMVDKRKKLWYDNGARKKQKILEVLKMSTFMAKPAEIQRKWYIVDAAGKPLGRTAVKVAEILRGKLKPEFTPHVDCGDHVVVINAEKVAVTGNKNLQKQYFHHTGHIAGERWINFADLLAKHPTAPLEAAIWGMLPHSALGHKMVKKLKIYAGAEHPHAAQNPEVVDF